MSKIVLVSGDRNWTNIELIKFWLKKLKDFGFDTLIEGEAKGADTIARIEGEKLGYTILNRDEHTRGFPAQWNKYPKYGAAGNIRNTEMLKVGKPEIILAFHPDISKSKGTKNMLEQAEKANIKYLLINDKGAIYGSKERKQK